MLARHGGTGEMYALRLLGICCIFSFNVRMNRSEKWTMKFVENGLYVHALSTMKQYMDESAELLFACMHAWYILFYIII